MNLAGQIDKLVDRGFSEERAETIVLMREAAILLFDAFPEMLVVVGGANLVLFPRGGATFRRLGFLSHCWRTAGDSQSKGSAFKRLEAPRGAIKTESNES